MKKSLVFLALAALVATSVSCSKSRVEQMAMAENVKVECTPEVLECVAGKIPVTITVNYPEGYFHPQALMVVTPVLVYEGGTLTGTSVIYQGEKVKDNNRVVSSKGGTVVQKEVFDYVKGVEKSHLELQCVAFYGSNRIDIPAIKVADGCNVTYMLAHTEGVYDYKKDGYQYVIHGTTEGQILYQVNSAEVRNSEVRSQSIKELQMALAEITEGERYAVTGNQVVAYASPEGGQDLNAKLSDKRAGTAKQAWKKISKGMETTDVQVKSVGQDWEGFQEAVSNSDIEDKELILRVLSMYSDPAVRESEIRNMSQVYTEINKKVFPALRRARFVTSYDYTNWTDEELKDLAEKAVNVLDEEALLKVASNTQDKARRRQLYQLAYQKFGSQRAVYNLGMSYLDEDDQAGAELWLDKVADPDADVLNARGVVAMRRGDIEKAVEFFNKSGNVQAKANLGTIDILNGNYAKAEKELAGSGTFNEALAHVLAGDYAAASAALKCKCADAEYLRAVIAARKRDAVGVRENLASAKAKNADLEQKAAKDVEFAEFR